MQAKYYVVEEYLREVDYDPFWVDGKIAVALLGMDEFMSRISEHGLGIDLDLSYDGENVRTTKAMVNYDSLTGTFSIPDRNNIFADQGNFLFAIRENGIVFLNDDGTAQKIIDKIRQRKKWKNPSLERFIYDFLETIISDDLSLLDKYELDMDAMEEIIDSDSQDEDLMSRLADIRSALQVLRIHYLQLADMAREFNENENGFFNEDNLRFFRMFLDRVERLEGMVSLLRDHTMQVRDLYQSNLAEQQNHIVTLLTIVTTIAVPLTFITGWYGMNFIYMPELSKPWAYPLIIAVCIGLSLGIIWYFKKKKWL